MIQYLPNAMLPHAHTTTPAGVPRRADIFCIDVVNLFSHLASSPFAVLQVYELSTQFLPKEWIMEKWEDGFYITAMAGSTSGSSLVVMSKGTPYTQQSYKVASLMPAK